MTQIPILQNIEDTLDGSGLHYVLVSWCIASFASYILVVVFMFLMLIAYTVLVGLNVFHKNDKQKRTVGVTVAAIFLVIFSLIAVCNRNYYV